MYKGKKLILANMKFYNNFNNTNILEKEQGTNNIVSTKKNETK